MANPSPTNGHGSSIDDGLTSGDPALLFCYYHATLMLPYLFKASDRILSEIPSRASNSVQESHERDAQIDDTEDSGDAAVWFYFTMTMLITVGF